MFRKLRLIGGGTCLTGILLFILGGGFKPLTIPMLASAQHNTRDGVGQPGFAQAADVSPIPPSYKSSPITITPDGDTLLVANPDSNTVTLVDTLSGAVIAEVPVGIDPRSVAVSLTGEQAFVANQGSDSLSVIDITAHVVAETISVGHQPVGVAVSPAGDLVALAERGDDTVRLLVTTSLETVALLPVADRPYGLVFTPDGHRLLVTHLLRGEVTLITLYSYAAFLPSIALDSHPTRAEFASPGPLATKIASTKPTALTIEQRSTPANPKFPSYILQSIIPTWENIAPAPAGIINSTGTWLYLPQTMANGQGLDIQFDATVFPKVSVINLLTNSNQLNQQISLPEADRPVGLPWDVALARFDSELWVVNSASNDISVVNISNPTHPVRTAHIPVGDNPRGIILSPDGMTAYVNNTLAGTVSRIDTSAYTVTQVITVSTIPLPPALLNGKRLFFSSASNSLAQARWISCNTCHVEGEADGRTWKVQYLGAVPPGEQAVITRNTSSLLGMIETYPLRWSAEWNESADSEFSVRFEQFGSGLIQGAMNPTLGAPNSGRSYDLDCLASFIDSLPAPPPRPHILTDSELRGKALFESTETRCAVCHPAPLYTDLLVHDVGTADGSGEWFGPGIDTPTLRFLYDSAPYLHDGSAYTLWEVLTIKNPADEHGVTSILSSQQLEDLIAFLLVLPIP